MKARGYTLLSAAVAALYCVMAFWTLPEIADQAGGLRPFDLRPFGYSPEEAQSFLDALSAEGRAYYALIQHRLDLVFPPLLALWLCLSARKLFAVRVAFAICVVAVVGMAADLGENHFVGELLKGFDTETVRLVSRLTVVKSVSATLCLLAVLWGFFGHLRASRDG